jgi:hypothetical protein
VAQGISPEFKPQYRKKIKREIKLIYSQPLIPIVSASVDSTNQRLNIFEKKLCVYGTSSFSCHSFNNTE